MAGLLGGVIALGGCASVALPLSEPLYRKDMSRPDTGRRIDATGPIALSHSISDMTKGLEPLERDRVLRAAIGLSVYQGCLDHGRFTMKDRSGIGRGWIRPEDCSKKAGRFQESIDGVMTGFRTAGRPDGNVLRDTTVLGDFQRRTRGWSDEVSWQRFHAFGAHSLNGLTRTEMMNRKADLLAGF